MLACRSAIFSACRQHTAEHKSPLRNSKIHRWLTFFSLQKTILWSDRGTRQVEEVLLTTKMRTGVKTGVEGWGSRVISTRSMTIQRGPNSNAMYRQVMGGSEYVCVTHGAQAQANVTCKRKKRRAKTSPRQTVLLGATIAQ